MKYEIPIRIIVRQPLPGVLLKVQRGRDELLDPANPRGDTAIFEFEITVDLAPPTPNFLGKYAQGPKDVRFIYVNAGMRAGQAHLLTHWDRRAKISLMGITREQIEAVAQDGGAILQTEFNGTGRDGGPTCASVKGIEWKVTRK